MKKIWIAPLLLVLLAGCVTTNVYFPSVAVEQAADRIIDEVWQSPVTSQGTK
jgi:hypothetical protein